MAGFGDSVLPEGLSINKPPGFNGENYSYWRLRMKIFFEAVDLDIWEVIEDGPYIPITVDENGQPRRKVKSEWNEDDRKRILLNNKAKLILASALSQNEYFRVSNCESAKEMWDTLEVTHEGTSGVKDIRINTLSQQYESFKMKSGESIKDLQIRFTHLINQMAALGKTYTQKELVYRIIRTLPSEWQPKVTAMEEVKGDSMKSVAAVFGALQEHEIKLAQLLEDQEKKKKGLALKAISLQQIAEDESDESSLSLDDIEINEENFSLFVKKFGKFFNNRRQGGRRSSKKNQENKETPICYECKKVGHIKWECPKFLKKQETVEKWKDKEKKKKAYISSTWGESDLESEEEEAEEANLCLMAREENEVCDQNLSPTYEELQDAFEELHDESLKIAKSLTTSKKKISFLENDLKKLKEENKILNETNFSLRKEIDTSNEEIKSLKEHAISPKESLHCCECEKHISEKEDLKNTLTKFTKGRETLNILLGKQRAVFDKAGLGYNPNTRQKYYKNFFVPATMSSSPYITCFYCGQKGHISQTCFYKKNGSFGNKKAWVPKGKTNTQGPKKVWVPKNKG